MFHCWCQQSACTRSAVFLHHHIFGEILNHQGFTEDNFPRYTMLLIVALIYDTLD